MNGRMEFAVAAVVILVAASVVPVVGSQHQIEVGEGGRDRQREPGVAGAATRADAEMVEVPVQIHTRDGVKEVTRELPVETVTTLYSMFNQTRRAVQTLQMAQPSSAKKQEAYHVIDIFLYKMKEHGLLGDISLQRVRELITGEQVRLDKDKHLAEVALFLERQGWHVNAVCGLVASGLIQDRFPWNALLTWLSFHGGGIISNVAYYLLIMLDAIPHPTTFGHWKITRPGTGQEAMVNTLGLFGRQRIVTEGGETWKINLLTLGFTGLVITFFNQWALGFCPFIAMKAAST